MILVTVILSRIFLKNLKEENEGEQCKSGEEAVVEKIIPQIARGAVRGNHVVSEH